VASRSSLSAARLNKCASSAKCSINRTFFLQIAVKFGMSRKYITVGDELLYRFAQLTLSIR